MTATARLPAGAAGRRNQMKLGRSSYVVKVGTSAKTRFSLTRKGRSLLRRRGRIKAQVKVKVTRDSSDTSKILTVRLKAPRRTS